MYVLIDKFVIIVSLTIRNPKDGLFKDLEQKSKKNPHELTENKKF